MSNEQHGELPANEGQGDGRRTRALRSVASTALAAENRLAEDGITGGPEPVLRVPEARTPLPAVDAAMPLFGVFAEVVGRRRARYKIALLKTLQADATGRWKIRRLQEIVHWLEPASVTDLVAELKASGVLSYEPVTAYYRLMPTARVVTALLDAMTIPEVDPRSLIKFLNKAMALAQAAGAGDDVVLRQFHSAIAVLKSDWDDLVRLLDDFSDEALLEAAELVRIHVDDMRELLDEHHTFFATQHEHALFLDADQEALDLVARLGTMSAEVIAAISGRADERMRAGMHVDRTDIREFALSQEESQLAALVAGLVAPPPYVVAVSAAAAFEALAEAIERKPSTPPPLPPPMALERRAPRSEPDAAQRMRDELRGLREPISVAALTARREWAESIGRHSALLDAYSRFDELPPLDHNEGFDEPEDSEVWRVSKTTVEAGE
jgi:hypothetical protein